MWQCWKYTTSIYSSGKWVVLDGCIFWPPSITSQPIYTNWLHPGTGIHACRAHQNLVPPSVAHDAIWKYTVYTHSAIWLHLCSYVWTWPYTCSTWGVWKSKNFPPHSRTWYNIIVWEELLNMQSQLNSHSLCNSCNMTLYAHTVVLISMD